jgi:diguanylate cyclase (GGDEF)-like protein
MPRLALAFVSVAALAATANFLVVKPESVARWVGGEPPAPRAVSTPRGVEPAVHLPIPELKLAIARFDEAAWQHAESGSPESAALLESAGAELHRIAGQFAADDLPGAALREHQQTAMRLVEGARDSRTTAQRYSSTMARLTARLQESIDGAWKIMGRVVARQSVLKLISHLDEMKSAFGARGPGSPADALKRMASAEAAFATTLQTNAVALRRSQGEAWMLDTQSDLATLGATRAAFARADHVRRSASESFARQRQSLTATLTELAGRANVQPAVAASPGVDPVAPPVAVLAPASLPVPKTHRHPLVGWLSIAVLALLAYVCVATIVSVVRPIRRLIAASARIAENGATAPVPVTGLRELQTLARAFNSMSERLAVAQSINHEVHRHLETKVEERTRELRDLAERDPLTGLANRRQLLPALNHSLASARLSKTRVGVFFLDIDNFKTLNDSMGHAYGDQVLIAIAGRLETIADAFGFAARLGGDEFMVVHEEARSLEEIVASGTAIVHAFAEPMRVEGRDLIVSVSVGASVFPDHEPGVEALLQAADAALFSAKALGRSRLTMFTPDLLERATAKFAIEQRLRRAIENQEFEIFYQPEIDAETLEVTLVEALIRWRMPDGSYQSPGEFLAVAEESSLIMDINDWVLRTAIQTAAQWHHGEWPAARVAVNVAPRQFLDPHFVDRLTTLLADCRLPASALELELTESVLQTGVTTIRTLERLRAMNVAVALDDFGTGYSSIASLEQLPLSRVKLDRSLIARIDSSPRSASIARATIGLCGELGLHVTAEGIERLAQFAALSGCRAMTLQGFLLADPVPCQGLLPLIRTLPAHCADLVLRSRLAGRGAPAPTVTDLLEHTGSFRH